MRLSSLFAKFGGAGSLLPLLPPPRSREGYRDVDLTASQILGGVRIFPSKSRGNSSDPAVFSGPGGDVVVALHDFEMPPYSFTDADDVSFMVPALFELPKSGYYNWTLIVLSYPPRYRLRPWVEVMEILAKGNDPRRKLSRELVNWAYSSSSKPDRRLLIVGPAGPLKIVERKLGGEFVDGRSAGYFLYSLIRGMPYLSNGDDFSTIPHLQLAAPTEIIWRSDHIEIGCKRFFYWYGGEITNKTLPHLLALPLDVLLEMEWAKNTSECYATPLLRLCVSNDGRHVVESLEERLWELGGWKRVIGPDLEKAWSAFIPGGARVPFTWGRHLVPEWWIVGPNPGILQQINNSLSFGDSNQGIVLGHSRGRVFTSGYLSRHPSFLFYGPSKIAGKTTTAQVLSAQFPGPVLWVDLTASPLDRVPRRAEEEGGLVMKTDFVDALASEGVDIVSKQAEINNVCGEIARRNVPELFEDWNMKGVIPRLITFRHKGTISFLAYLEAFLGALKANMVEWHQRSGDTLLIVFDNFSALAEKLADDPLLGDLPERIARKLAGQIAWFVSNGANHGFNCWVISHSIEDLERLLGQGAAKDFSFCISMGGGHVNQLIDPRTGETIAEINQQLPLELLRLVERLRPGGLNEEERVNY